MKLLFNGTEQFVDLTNAEEVIEAINGLLGDTFYLQSLRIDEEEWIEGPEQYLAENFDEIEVVEVMGVPGETFIPELIEAGEEYLLRLEHNLPTVLESFEKGATSEDWAALSDFFGGMQWLLSMRAVVDESNVRPERWDDVMTHGDTISNVLPSVEHAVAQEDVHHLIEIFQKDLIPALKNYQESLTTILEHEVKRPTSQ